MPLEGLVDPMRQRLVLAEVLVERELELAVSARLHRFDPILFDHRQRPNYRYRRLIPILQLEPAQLGLVVLKVLVGLTVLVTMLVRQAQEWHQKLEQVD
jgi:hypothetical protein